MNNKTLQVYLAVAETIREVGETPSGPLYALLMDRMSFATYTSIIASLKAAGLVSEKNYLLTWIGPKL